ncbi:MAG: hypothetical protein LBC86_04320 [Oscillospiraceae bacterium]|nr:hypothetical protein [Oscillospiraceae bacterium]
MIKGKSTIELFDSITGKKKEEYKDENIVTDAIRNMFDWNGEMLASGVSISDMLARLTPLYPQYLRGILLWDSIVNENVNNILPPPGINCVGHAGGNYGGANPLRGCWNENETEIRSNGVKMVWDFATDKANSVINSISLTSVAGGDRGWMTPWEAGTFFRQRINIDNINQNIVGFAPSSINTFTNVLVSYVGELRRGIHTYVLDRNDNALTILEQSFANPSSLSILNGAGLLTSSPTHCREDVFSVQSDSRFNSLFNSHIIDKNNNLVHVSLPSGGSGAARIRTVNLITKTIIEDKIIPLNVSIQANSSTAFFKNKLYVNSTAGRIMEVDDSGNFIRNVSDAPISGRYVCIGGEYLISPFVSNTGLFINDGFKSVITQLGNDNINMPNLFNSASLKYPLIALLHEQTSNFHTKYIGYITPYMATINNLHTPVTKNALNTMKITYELTQE